jgi:hypothetical protein
MLHSKRRVSFQDVEPGRLAAVVVIAVFRAMPVEMPQQGIQNATELLAK